MEMWVEYFGTAMSAIIAVSLMQKNIRWLRIFNTLGSGGFAVYGLLIGALPVIILNCFIVVVNTVYLIRMRNSDEKFDFLPVEGLQSLYVRKFIDFHRQDIQNIFPSFNPEDREGVQGCLILRDAIPVSLVLYRLNAEEGDIIIDYSVPSHRDRTNAKYFFEYVLRHVDLGQVKRMKAGAESPVHRQYLKQMGFTPLPGEEESFFVREISS
ncbi:MAG: hypothetical protein PQJ50_00965 [Spirochaetales bacterium]|nr:hypothetical protein [Spirochaetales bacterium]